MAVDTSALIAVVKDEPERDAFLEALVDAPSVSMSALSWMETRTVVLSRLGEPGLVRLAKSVAVVGVEMLPVSPERADRAFEAFRRYGKGRHPARLNICDCFAYALARELAEPLLFKGDDFPKTDVTPAVSPI